MRAVGKTKRLLLILAAILFLATTCIGFFAASRGTAYAAGGIGSGDTYNYNYSGSLQINDLTYSSINYYQASSKSNHYVCQNSVLCSSSGNPTGRPDYVTVDPKDCSQADLSPTQLGAYTSKSSTTTDLITIYNTETLSQYKSDLGCTLPTKLTAPNTSTALGSPSPSSPTTTSATPTTTSATPASTSSSPSCEESGGVLDWVFCAVYDALNSVTGLVLNDFIMPELRISPLCVSSTGGANCIQGDPTYQIWSSFRLYGDIILVIALLVVVASEAMGGGLIDAYSVRKILPRILVAAILLNISIYVVAALVDVTNIIGGSIGAVITDPIKSTGAFHINPNGKISLGGWLAVGVIGAGTVVGAGALHILPHVGALFSHAGGSILVDGILVPALLIFLGILLTIVIRKTAIIALIILSPLAFAFYVLPNTQKLFKRWWDLLLEMLMVYPIIVLIFAVSSVMSVLVTLPSDGDTNLQGAINSLLALVFTILPLVLVPFSFKFAGDTIGRIASFVDSGRSQLMNMTQNRRQRSRETYATRVAGERQKQYSRLSNTAYGKWLAKESGPSRWVGRGYRRISEQASQGAVIAAGNVPKLPGWATMEHNSNALIAVTNGGNFERTKREIQELGGKRFDEDKKAWVYNMDDASAENAARSGITTARTAIGFGAAQAYTAAKQRVVNGTDVADASQLHRMIAQVSGGDESLAWSLSGDLNAVTKQVGRHDLAGGVAQIKEMSDLYRMQMAGHGTEQWKNSGKTVDEAIEDGIKKTAIAGWDSGTLGQHATNKAQDIKNSVSIFTKMLQNPSSKEDENAAIKFFREIKGLQGYPYASGDFINEVNKGLGGVVIDRNAEGAQIVDQEGKPVHISVERFIEKRLNEMSDTDRDSVARSIRRADNRPPTGDDGSPNPSPEPPPSPAAG